VALELLELLSKLEIWLMSLLLAGKEVNVMSFLVLIELEFEELELCFGLLFAQHFFPQFLKILVALIRAALQFTVQLLAYLVELVTLHFESIDMLLVLFTDISRFRLSVFALRARGYASFLLGGKFRVDRGLPNESEAFEGLEGGRAARRRRRRPSFFESEVDGGLDATFGVEGLIEAKDVGFAKVVLKRVLDEDGGDAHDFFAGVRVFVGLGGVGHDEDDLELS
jgi:hypothetical protein